MPEALKRDQMRFCGIVIWAERCGLGGLSGAGVIKTSSVRTPPDKGLWSDALEPRQGPIQEPCTVFCIECVKLALWAENNALKE